MSKELLAQALREYPTWGEAYLAERERRLAAEAALADTRRALEHALDCKGSFNGTVSERGGDPAICTKCEEEARRALAASEPTGPTEERCPVPGCTLPKGHNRGRADIPENHRKAIGPTEEQT